MAKLRVCKACGAQIAKSAKACPQCGAKQHKGARIVGALLVVLIIILFFAMCKSIFSKDPVETAKPVNTAVQGDKAASPSENQAYGIGDTLEMKNVRATLTDVRILQGSQYSTPEEGNEFVIYELEIENCSDEEIAVSSLLCFTAYADDYKLEFSLSAMAQDKGQQLDGTIAAGKKLKGVVGFEAPEGWSTTELHFKPSVWTGSAFVFTAQHP